MATFLELCKTLEVLVEVKKCESASNKLTYLGIEIDTTAGELHLLEEKLQRVKAVVQEWLGCKVGRRRELESLMGYCNMP